MIKYLIFITIVLLSCSAKEKPILLIGSSLNKNGVIPSVSGSTDISEYGKIAFLLKQESDFNISKLTMRINKYTNGSTYSKIIYSSEIDIDPTGNWIANEIEASEFIEEYGDGKFEIQFLNENKEFASQQFTLVRSKIEEE